MKVEVDIHKVKDVPPEVKVTERLSLSSIFKVKVAKDDPPEVKVT